MTTVLWCRQPLCIITPQLELAKRKKQKVVTCCVLYFRPDKCNPIYFQIVKMLVVLIVIFGVCWLPYHVYFLYSYHYPDVRSLPYIQHVFLGFYWCAMAHSMVNPIVYYFMNPKYVVYHTKNPALLHILHSRFRHYYKHILTFRWLHSRQPDAPTGLIMASTFGLKVAAHLALDHETAHDIELEMEDEVGNETGNRAATATRASLKIDRIPSRTMQTSSLASSITSRRKVLSLGNTVPDPDIVITTQIEDQLTPVSETVKDNLVLPSPVLSHHSKVLLLKIQFAN